MENRYLLSLDIGTRKIAAFVTKEPRETDGRQEIVASRIVEHEGRVVRAGQIHDIEKVAQVVSELKGSLEREIGAPLGSVATAIAGRNLKSLRASGEVSFGHPREVAREDMRAAELSAVNAALAAMGAAIDGYYLVGHAIAAWKIDGETVAAPLGHYAGALAVEMIATFLPRSVLESVVAVTRKAGLEIAFLTLEPIAAAEAVFPPEMRHIPVALVDIGAGTSDIAVIAGGSIQSFGMLPLAGDSITEAVSSEFLVGFAEAERIKRELRVRLRASEITDLPGMGLDAPMIHYQDIFGRNQEQPAAAVMEKIAPAVRELARGIAAEIKSLLASRPGEVKNFAVVLVGGGALTPGLDRELAAALGISEMRVGLRTPAMAGRFVPGAALHGAVSADGPYYQGDRFGPHTAVALGVTCLAADSPDMVLMHVTVNERKLELLSFKGSELTVLSALVAAGITKQRIFGRPGLAMTVTVNGELKVIKGRMPAPARIEVNGEPAAAGRTLAEGDRIRFMPANDGLSARGTVADVLPAASDGYSFNGEPAPFPCAVTVNGVPAELTAELRDHDTLTVEAERSLAKILAGRGIGLESRGAPSARTVAVDVMGSREVRAVRNYSLMLNGRPVTDTEAPYLTVEPGDRVEFHEFPCTLKAGDFLAVPPQGKSLKVRINNDEFVFPGSRGKILLNGREVDEGADVADGDIIRAVPGRDAEAVLVDIFRYIEIDPRETAGKKLKLLVNQQEANFMTPLADGAEITIGFE